MNGAGDLGGIGDFGRIGDIGDIGGIGHFGDIGHFGGIGDVGGIGDFGRIGSNGVSSGFGGNTFGNHRPYISVFICNRYGIYKYSGFKLTYTCVGYVVINYGS